MVSSEAHLQSPKEGVDFANLDGSQTDYDSFAVSFLVKVRPWLTNLTDVRPLQAGQHFVRQGARTSL